LFSYLFSLSIYSLVLFFLSPFILAIFQLSSLLSTLRPSSPTCNTSVALYSFSPNHMHYCVLGCLRHLQMFQVESSKLYTDDITNYITIL
jgi:hypothetical protein